MMEPMTEELSGVSKTSISLMSSEEWQQPLYRMLIVFTVTVEAVDRLPVHAETQVEDLRHYRMNLGLVRFELATMQAFISSLRAVGTTV